MAEKEKPHPSAANTDRIGPRNHSFNIHRCLKDYKDNWQDSPLAPIFGRNPTLTAGSAGIFTHVEPELFSVLESSGRILLHPYEWISIDKIAILFNVPPIKDDAGYCKGYWEVFKALLDASRITIKNSTNHYRSCCIWFEDFYLQWGGENSNTLRIEFNPNNADLECLVPLLGILKPNALRTARVSRIDVAIDYAIYLNPLSWHIKQLSKWSKFGDKSDIETLNFGAPTSARKIRIYNKQKEVAKDKKIDIGFDYWRVESEVTSIKGSSFFISDFKTIFNYNPFVGLGYIDQFGFELKGQGVYNLFVLACRAFGIDFAASQIDRKTRKKYLNQLQSDSNILPIHLPSDIYAQFFPDIYRNFYNKLHKLFSIGQEAKNKFQGNVTPENKLMIKHIKKGLNDEK